MTDRLYYTDAAVAEFDAELLQIVAAPDGRPGAILDRTAFYPTSGGQPFDTGTLNSSRIVDVLDLEDGTILHVLDTPLEPGPVRGCVDKERRRDHMQQHSGQHLLSAVFDRVLSVATISFHLGAEISTIDLAREVSALEIARVEEEANRIVWEDVPVTVRFAEAAEAATLPLRKAAPREGRLRLVQIGDVDLSACGGTHVATTGAIGLIAVTRWERLRGGTRIEFVCGRRALRSHGALRDIVATSVQAMSVAAPELPAAIERLQADTRDLRRQAKDLQGRLASHEAAALAVHAEHLAASRVVVAVLDGWDAAGLKQVATAIVTRPAHAAVLLSSPAPSSIVVARSQDVTLDCGALLKQMVARFGGKGGGRADLAQGGGLAGSTDDMLAHARALMSTCRSAVGMLLLAGATAAALVAGSVSGSF